MKAAPAVMAVVLCLAVGVSCSRDPKVVSQKYLQSGNKYFDKGKFKEASIMYRKALTKYPKFGEAYYRLGLSQSKLNNFGEAIAAFRRGVDESPAGAIKNEAREQLSELLLFFYSSPRFRGREGFQKELELLTAQMVREPKTVAQSHRVNGYLAMIRDRDFKAATESLRKAYQLSPKAANALPLIQSLFNIGEIAEGEKIAHEVIAKEKSYTPLYDVVYVQYIKTNRLADAEALRKLEAGNNPANPIVAMQLAAHYHALRREDEMKKVLDRLSSDSKTFPKGRDFAAEFYTRIGRFDSAIQQYERALRADSNQKQHYQTQIAQVLIKANKPEEAAKMVQQILDENPDDTQAKALRASLLLETGDTKSLTTTIADLQAAINRDPKNPTLRYDLARAFLLKKPPEWEQAKTQLREAIELRRDYIEPMLVLAQLHVQRREFAAALDRAKAAADINPRSVNAKLLRSVALLGLGNTAEARTDLAQTVKDHPNSRDAVMQMAVLDLNEKRFKEAEQGFGRLHQAGDIRGILGLSDTLAMQRQYDKAIDLISKESSKNPADSKLKFALGNLLVRSNRYDEAIAEYQALVQKNPKDIRTSDVYVYLGETYRKKGDLQAAIANFRKAKDLRPEEPSIYLPLALLLDGTGQKQEAKVIYQEVLRREADNPIALNNLAYMITESGGSLDQALTLAQRAKQKLPQDANVADTLGWIYIKKNLSDNAIEIFRGLVDKHPNVSTFRYHLAMALFQKGDKPGAKKELQAALQNKPAKEEEGKIRELMGKIG